MVDFKDGITVGTPAVDIFRVEALEAQSNAIAAYETYRKQKEKGIEADLSVTKARLVTWFLIHQPYLKRTRKKQEYESIYKPLFGEEDIDESTAIEILLYLNEVLDGLQITKLDTKTKYDRTQWEEENKMSGL